MGRKCSVENCTSDASKPEHTGVTFHKVPLHSDVRPKWLSLCHIPEDKNSVKMLFVCSRHFLRADFCSFKGKKYLLRQGVLPSVFPWDKSKLEAIKAEVTGKKDVEVSKKKEKGKGLKKKGAKAADIPIKPKSEILDSTSIKEASEVTHLKTELIIKEEPQEIKIEPEDVTLEDKKSPVDSESSVLHMPPMLEPPMDPFDEHQRSQNASPTSSCINFTINSQIEVLDNNNIWCLATISEVDYEENEILIHFEKISNKCDEWISMSSPRLRSAPPVTPTIASPEAAPLPEPVHLPESVLLPEPVPPTVIQSSGLSFEIGERCMAVWSDSRKFPATVSKKLEDDSYEVLFDDGFTKAIKSHRMSKMNLAKTSQSSPLFDPVKGTKQDRRDKKRKLNVAALFSKRPKLSHPDEKKTKTSPVATVEPPQEEVPPTEVVEELTQPSAVPAPEPIPKWLPSWEDGKPVGVESTIDGLDGLRKSIIVPDPRLPVGWAKHVSQRIQGSSFGKWDCIIIAPDGKKFRARNDIKNYLELHPGVEATLEMFDFSLYRAGKTKKKPRRPKQTKVQAEPPADVTPIVEEIKPLVEKPVIKEEVPVPEEPPINLKIVFENDSYKCPIDGCGKNFRRENLALMHVKHYHSEYTKYLDSTPNVADLAYARTVGENLDKSPGPQKLTSSKTALEKTPVTPKVIKGPIESHSETSMESSPCLDSKRKDFEIIKLLNQKPVDINKDVHPLPPGLPTNMYPDIKLKDLLGKTDDMAMRDDVHIKNLCSSRPSQGIKTLLPVRQAPQTPPEVPDEKTGSKRKRTLSDAIHDAKGKLAHHHTPHPATTPTHESQPIAPVASLQPLHPATPSQTHHPPQQTDTAPVAIASVEGVADDDTAVPSIPSAFDLAPPPAGLETKQPPSVTQFDGVIIEGGKIIKLERMKQEEIINCTCGFTEEDGLMIQCELCLCWQHAYCNNIQKESEVPEKYVCYICQHPLRERHSAKYLHDQDWLKQGVLPVASFHSKDKRELETRFEKLKKCHDLSGGLLELREYMHTLGVKLKIAEAKNHPKLYLWSKMWDKPKLPEKLEVKSETSDLKPKLEDDQTDVEMTKPSNDSMLMMILKSDKEETPMLNNITAPIIPQPEAAINSDDCRLNLLDHIAHAESLIEERLDDFEKQLEALEEGMNLETDEDYPKTRQTVQLLLRDLGTLKRFSELPMI